jgi:hypothetical protein
MAHGRRQDPREALLKEEWTKSLSTQATITKLVKMGILPEPAVGGWRPSSERYLRPRDGELVIFEDFYLRGFGTPVHTFLRKLLNFYKISLCNLHPQLYSRRLHLYQLV